MALFTDGPLSNAADLQRCENAILSVATTESIDIGSKLVLAQQELANETSVFLSRRATSFNDLLGIPRRRGVDDVVVTEPLRAWHVYKTLALIYRDAYNNQLNDRYQGKWQEYERLAKVNGQAYFKIGVGLVSDPVRKAGAPTLSTVVGGGTGGAYYAAVTWVGVSGQEGAPSDISGLTTAEGQQLEVKVGDAPRGTVGWNVYVGTSPVMLNRQNGSPLAASNSWIMSAGPTSGAPLPSGQKPAWFVVDDHGIQRG